MPFIDQAAVASLQIELYITLDRVERAAPVCIDLMKKRGVDWTAHPSDRDVRDEYDRLLRQIGDRTIESLIDLPLMGDTAARATMDVLQKFMPAATFIDLNLGVLVSTHMANLSLEHGYTDASASAYLAFSMFTGPIFGDYGATLRFGQLGVDLVDKRGLDGFAARVFIPFGTFVIPWVRHIPSARPFLQRTFEIGTRTGDITHAAYSRSSLVTNLLASGDPLADVERAALDGLEFATNARFGQVIDWITGQLRLVRTLRGMTRALGSFDDAEFDETRYEQHLEANPSLSLATCLYWIRKMQARLLAGDVHAALAAGAKADALLWTSRSFFEHAEYQFYAALARAGAATEEPGAHREALGAHHRQLELWAKICPENFEDRAALVGAEIAHLEGRELEAMRLYEQAIRSARANGFVHNEAIAYEVAARFYATRGFEDFAHVYLRKAHDGYLRWGADGKVRQLEELYPHLRTEEPALAPTSTIGAPVESLDLATVIKVSQAVSSEIVLEKLIDTLMRTAIEQAGAERGLLILPLGVEQRIEAEATTAGDRVIVHLRDEVVTEAVLPESVLHYVLRTRESVILDDAAARSAFAEDPYIRQRQARSVLCLPLISQAKLTGVLYLENNLARSVFAPARTAVLKLLASQAAIALENTHLYRDLAEREAKIRRLVEANIIGVFVGDFDGRILEANDAFLQIVGYDREDLAAGRINWKDLTPRDWRERDAQWIEEHKRTGVRLPTEKEYFRKDGRRVPILLGSATVEEGGNQSVTFVLDLTERKQAEAEARESERRYRETQTQLAHANRVATMGQLTASIAHEVNQPIAATVANARAALRWLGAEPPNLDEIRQTLGRIVRDGDRAGAVVGRIRALIKGAPPRDERVEINAAIRDVIEFTHCEAMKNRVSVRTELVEGLPLVQGDRVELQQVILNLILNAVEAMSEMSEGSRELLITTGKTESGEVLVAVRDSGPGLTPATLEHLFVGLCQSNGRSSARGATRPPSSDIQAARARHSANVRAVPTVNLKGPPGTFAPLTRAGSMTFLGAIRRPGASSSDCSTGARRLPILTSPHGRIVSVRHISSLQCRARCGRRPIRKKSALRRSAFTHLSVPFPAYGVASIWNARPGLRTGRLGASCPSALTNVRPAARQCWRS